MKSASQLKSILTQELDRILPIHYQDWMHITSHNSSHQFKIKSVLTCTDHEAHKKAVYRGVYEEGIADERQPHARNSKNLQHAGIGTGY